MGALYPYTPLDANNPARIDNYFATSGSLDSQLSAAKSDRRAALYKGLMARLNPYSESVVSRESDEEAGFAASERMERDLALRKIKDERIKTETKVESKDLAEFYFGKQSEQKTPTVLKSFLDGLRNMKNATADDILKDVGRRFSDVSDQYIALSFVEEEFRAEGDSRMADLVAQAKEQLMNKSGPAVRAGLNIAQAAIQESQGGLGEFGELRDFYRDTILSHDGILSTYRSLREEYGPGKLRQGLDFLIKAATADINAQGPSIEKGHLKAIIDNFYEVGVINNISRSLASLLERMRKNYGDGISTDVESLMERIFELVEALRVDFGVIVKIPENMGAKELSWQIYFLTDLYEQMRLLPIKIYPTSDHRTRLLAAAQQALDYIIEEEETQVEGEENNPLSNQ